MRAFLAAALAIAAIGVFAQFTDAAAADGTASPNATPLISRIGFFDRYVYRPPCPYGYYYSCRVGPLGYRQCACWRDFWRSY